MSALEEYETVKAMYTSSFRDYADAAIESLKVCGNCGRLVSEITRTYTIKIFKGQRFPTSRTMQCAEDGTDVCAWQHRCHFTPSRWENL